MLDFQIDFQSWRHRDTARLARKALYHALVGAQGWPPTFRRPSPEGQDHVGASPHIYVHIPFCRSICPHCPYNKLLFDADLADRYGRALIAEIDAYLAWPGRVPIESLYFGGGTPSMTVGLVETIAARLRPHLSSRAEIGIEVHPLDATLTLFQRLRALGVTSVSLGVETLDPALLKMLGRRYSPDLALRAIADAKAAGFECVDVNMLFGMPGEDPDGALQGLSAFLKLGADQISAYPLFTFIHTKLGDRVAKGKFPIFGDAARLQLQRRIGRTCLDAGLERSSVWSFTRPGVRPYTTVTRDDYRGFGAGAGSKIDGTFFFNTFSTPAYAAADPLRPALLLQANERMRRAHWLYWRIYCTRIDPAEYEHRFGRSLARDFPLLFTALRLVGWARRDGRVWRLTERGAVWTHRMQCLFSITYIDELWAACKREAWPEAVELDPL